jgi:excisionase family DNA binding protein
VNALGAAFIDALDDDTIRKLIDRAWPMIAERLAASDPAPDGWLDSIGAAAYLSLSRHALHKLTASREIPFEQDGPGCKLWFKRSELDAWRRGDRRLNPG